MFPSHLLLYRHFDTFCALSTPISDNSTSAACVLDIATFLASNHSMPNVNGMEAATSVVEMIITWLIAVFQINLWEVRSSGDCDTA